MWPGLGLSAETESMRALPLHSLSISYQNMCIPNMFRYIWRSVTRRFRYIEIVELFYEPFQNVLIHVVGIPGLCRHDGVIWKP